MTAIATVVSAGVQTLNDHFGGNSWVTDIDLDTLVLSDGDHCVIGQLFRAYSKGIVELSGKALYSSGLTRWAADRGFTVHYDDGMSWADLTEHWKHVISEMRTDRDRDLAALTSLIDGNPWGQINPEVSASSETVLIAAGRLGLVDLFLAATGRPESDRTIVEALFS